MLEAGVVIQGEGVEALKRIHDKRRYDHDRRSGLALGTLVSSRV